MSRSGAAKILGGCPPEYYWEGIIPYYNPSYHITSYDPADVLSSYFRMGGQLGNGAAVLQSTGAAPSEFDHCEQFRVQTNTGPKFVLMSVPVVPNIAVPGMGAGPLVSTKLRVTLTGLRGDFSIFNGIHYLWFAGLRRLTAWAYVVLGMYNMFPFQYGWGTFQLTPEWGNYLPSVVPPYTHQWVFLTPVTASPSLAPPGIKFWALMLVKSRGCQLFFHRHVGDYFTPWVGPDGAYDYGDIAFDAWATWHCRDTGCINTSSCDLMTSPTCVVEGQEASYWD